MPGKDGYLTEHCPAPEGSEQASYESALIRAGWFYVALDMPKTKPLGLVRVAFVRTWPSRRECNPTSDPGARPVSNRFISNSPVGRDMSCLPRVDPLILDRQGLQRQWTSGGLH